MPKTIWSLETNKLGDILVGSEDKTIRTFTRDAKRAATEEDLNIFQSDCDATAKKQAGYDLATLKDFDTEIEGKVQGTKDGEVTVFKSNNKAMAYGWNQAEGKWNVLGEVMADPNAVVEGDGISTGAATKHYGGDNLFEAGEYDHIFDVELGDGVLRKLPFNNGTSRDESAALFCAREGLSRVMVTEIINFLKTNASDFQTRDLTKKDNKPVEAKCEYIPFNNYLFFDAAKLEGLTKKVLEFNGELNLLDEGEIVFYH